MTNALYYEERRSWTPMSPNRVIEKGTVIFKILPAQN